MTLLPVASANRRVCACGSQSVHPPRVHRAKFCITSKNSLLLHHSGRRIYISQPTDLDIITSEREITLVEQLALPAICCTSACFIGGLWATDPVHLPPLTRQSTPLSVHLSHLYLISFFTQSIDAFCLMFPWFNDFLRLTILHVPDTGRK